MRLPRMVSLSIAVGLGFGAAALGVACSFPDIQYSASGGGAATGTGGAPTSSGTGGAPTGTGGAPTGTGGSGGATTTTTSTGAGGDGMCDHDRDGELSVSCEGGTDCDDDSDNAQTVLCEGGTDCYDFDPLVRPGQSMWFETAHPEVGFDYNCNGMEDVEIGYVACNGLNCDKDKFLENVPCGETGAFGDCAGALCGPPRVTTNIRRCH